MIAEYNFRAQELKNNVGKVSEINAVLSSAYANHSSAYENATNVSTNKSDSIFGAVGNFRAAGVQALLNAIQNKNDGNSDGDFVVNNRALGG